MNIAEVKNLSYTYNGRVNALEGINFTVEKGDFTGILGPNGSGKTTLAKIMLGLLRPPTGSVALLGQDINNFTQWQKIGYLEQKNTTPAITPLTAFEVARMGLLSVKKTPRIL